ncbi:MAG: 4Fe-4S binding protein [Spirochaetota bacterium]
MDNIYNALQKRLDMYSLGFPETKSKIEITILKKLFSEDDAKLFLELSPALETAESIAARIGKQESDIKPHLEDMVKRGLLFKKTKDGVDKYGAIPFIHGVFEFQVKRLSKDLAMLLEQYFEEGLSKAVAKSTNLFLRPIPVNESIETKSTVAPFEDAVAIIKQAPVIAVADCICRKEKKIVGKGCDKPMETCLMFGSMAEYYIDNNLGRKISADEAIAIVKEAQRHGMVTQPGTAQNPAGMCSCCGDCCAVLLSIKRFPKPSEMVFSNYYAESNDNCTACGNCVDMCQMEAIDITDIAHVNKDRCIGCGLCVMACPNDAIKLVQKEQSKKVPPKTSGEQMLQMAKQRGIL